MGVESAPEIGARESELAFLIGYYALMLESSKLSPEWRTNYEERQQGLIEELSTFKSKPQ